MCVSRFQLRPWLCVIANSKIVADLPESFVLSVPDIHRRKGTRSSIRLRYGGSITMGPAERDWLHILCSVSEISDFLRCGIMALCECEG